MHSKIIPFLIAIILLLACRHEKHGLNPVPNKRDTYSAMQNIVNHIGNIKRVQTIKLKFSLQSLQKDDSSNTFRFTIISLRLEPTPSYLLQVVNFDSLQAVIASCPYEVTVDKIGRVNSIKGELKMQNSMLAIFTSRYIARSFTADHLGANAVEDFLNRFFSVVPYKEIKDGDNWVKDITFVTKAPVKHSNLFTYQRRTGDSVFVQIKSLISADQGDTSTVYMKGNQLGGVIVSASTGMPYFYNTNATTVTSTVAGDQMTDESFEIRRLP